MDQIKPDWWVEGICTLVGAGFGAFLGSWLSYILARKQRSDETRRRRTELLKHLDYDLGWIRYNDDLKPDLSKTVTEGKPVHFGEVDLLLDGQTLNYEEHGSLLRTLLLLQGAIRSYNQWVETSRLVPSQSSDVGSHFFIPVQSHRDAVREEIRKLNLLPGLQPVERRNHV